MALGRLRAERRLPRLEGQDPAPLSPQPSREADEPLPVERLEPLDVAGDHLHARDLRVVLEEVRDGQVHLVPVRDRGEREDQAVHVARERDEVGAALAHRHQRLARRVVERQLVLRQEERVVLPLRDEAEAVPAEEDRTLPGAAPRIGERTPDLVLQPLLSGFGEAARDQDDRLGLAALRERDDRVARSFGRDAHHRQVDRLGEELGGGDARDAVDRSLLRVDRVEVPVREPLGGLQVLEDDPAGVQGARRRPEDGGAPGLQEVADLPDRAGRGDHGRRPEAPLPVDDEEAARRGDEPCGEALGRRCQQRTMGRSKPEDDLSHF